MGAPHEQLIRFLNVELGPDGIAERDGRTLAVTVARRDVMSIEVRRGSPSERPIVHTVVATAMLGLGLFVLARTCVFIGPDIQRAEARIIAVGGILGFVGACMIWWTFRPMHYLHIRTSNDARKILFQGAVDLRALAAALQVAEERFGYSFTWRIPKPTGAAPPYRF
jgi:hypothetical protein